MRVRVALGAALLGLAACGSSATEISDRTVEVGCAMCQFEMEGAETCFWAARFDGKTVTVRGDALPEDHDAHAPDGMCNVTRQAVVSGTLYPTYFLATKFELLPIDPSALPAEPHAHEH